jgi:UDP:flavonoid glycosyltransferase YjiC (YdhE family)
VVEAEGLLFKPLRPDITPEDTAILERVMDPHRGSEVVVREIVAGGVRDAYADTREAAMGADLIVSHPITFASPIVADAMKLPWISSVLSPLSFFSAYDFPVMPNMPAAVHLRRLGPWTGRLLMMMARRVTAPWTAPVRQFRAELGLPPSGDPLYEGQFSPLGTIAMFSPIFGSPQRDWPARTMATGFSFFNHAIPMPAELAAFLDAGDPPVVFTLGTSAVSVAGSFYEESVTAVAALRRRAVLLVGRDPRNRPSRLPDGVIAIDSAPHDQLFPRAAAIVHQGGVGTTAQALRSGRPTLVVPHAHDQPDNAFRVVNLGVGRELYPRRYRAPRVAAHLRALLEDPRYAERAVLVGRQIRAEDGAARACDVLVAAIR